jgi:hypothetical protein
MKSWICIALFAITALAIVPCQAGVRRCLTNIFCDKLGVIGEGLYVRWSRRPLCRDGLTASG